MMQFVLKHRKEAIVIMEKAQGSCYEGFRSRIENMMEQSFRMYYQSRLETPPDEGLIRILARQRLESCLYARAKESGKKNPKIRDDMAVKIVSRLDYDFSNADKDKAMSYGVIARTIVLDEMIEKYLSRHPKSVVVNIASGMDTRCYRMQGKYLRWYNVDLPETMEIRAKFLDEKDPVYQIAASAMDESYTDDIICEGEDILVVIEGLSMYLKEEDILDIFSIIEKRFSKAVVMIETMSPFVVQHVKEKSIEGSNAKFTWGIKNGKLLQKLVPSFTYRGEVSLIEGMKKIMPIYHVIGKLPAVQNFSNKIIVLEKE